LSVLFFGAAACGTWRPNPVAVFDLIVVAARRGLTLTLFLIGVGLTIPKLKAVGVRPLILGVTLWIVISVTTLIAVRSFV